MSGNERLRDKWPMLNAFGGSHVFLDTEGALAATPDGRIQSAWPYLVRRVLAFCKGLKPRERTNYDAEDVIAELYLALAAKDAASAARARQVHHVRRGHHRPRVVRDPRQGADRPLAAEFVLPDEEVPPGRGSRGAHGPPPHHRR